MFLTIFLWAVLVYFKANINNIFMQFFSEKVNSLLLEMEAVSDAYWNVPKEVAQILYFLVLVKGAKKIMEIGTSNGYSGIWLAKALEQNEGRLFTIESHNERYRLASENFKKAGVDSVVIQILGHAPEVFLTEKALMDGGFDLVFMDATKKQHKEFLNGIFDLLNLGGVIVVDNVLSHWGEMQSLVDYVDGIESLDSQLVRVGDGLLMMIKKGNRLSIS